MTLLRYYGGQSFKLKTLLELMPPHHIYVEVFGGAAHLLFNKPPSPVEIYNDIDRYLVDFFRVLQDEEKYRRLIWRLKWTLYSREEFNRAREIVHERKARDDVEAAWAFYVYCRQSFAGSLVAGWSYDLMRPRYLSRDFYKQTWYETEFKRVRMRLAKVNVECDDWRVILKRYDTEKTLFFLDPPYPPSVIRTKQYIHMLSEEDHMELAEALKKIKGMFMLITYRTDYYDAMGVNHVDITSKLHTSKRKKKEDVVVRLYYNFQRPTLDAVRGS